jgi:hypothetical protein|tara:strand:+ start:3675 stop:4217 length:543 start_codon:yes stop_codon:yes gene_type:complete
MNTFNLSLSSTKADINSEKILDEINLFDFTEVTLDISNIYTEVFPTYVTIDWGDGSDVFNPDIKIYRDYRTESIFPEVEKGVTPVTFTNNYTHKYYPSSFALKKSLNFKMNIGYVTGETLRFNVPIIVNSQSYYENVEDIDIVGVDMLNDATSTSRVTFLTKNNSYLVQLDNKSYKENSE